MLNELFAPIITDDVLIIAVTFVPTCNAKLFKLASVIMAAISTFCVLTITSAFTAPSIICTTSPCN